MNAKYYVGIDLGSRFHQVAVVDQQSGVVRPSFRIGRGRRGVELLLSTLGVPGSSLVVSNRLRARQKQPNVALCATAARLLERVYDVMAERRSTTVMLAAD